MEEAVCCGAAPEQLAACMSFERPEMRANWCAAAITCLLQQGKFLICSIQNRRLP